MNLNQKSSSKNIQELLSELTDEDLLPHYKEVYSAETVSLENIESLLTTEPINQKVCLQILSNSCNELKADFNNYLLDSYESLEEKEDRLAYLDIANISHFVIRKYKMKETACFPQLFQLCEQILERGDDDTRNLIVVGLFEGIQNIGGWHDVGYHHAFDKWLQPKSKKAWDDLIDLWEGDIKNK